MLLWLWALLGLAILLAAGDALVRGAVNLALRLHVPPFLIGVTVIGFGTSAPELMATISAVLKGAPGIALGNIIGSNIANVLLILGVPALLAPLRTGAHDARKSYLQMLAVTLLFIGLLHLGEITRVTGAILVALLFVMLRDKFRDARQYRTLVRNGEEPMVEIDGADPDAPGWKVALFIVAGFIGLPLGADILVTNAAEIARTFGIRETAIGITLIAFGTSLPELASTLLAALRRRADLALGNVLGSNMFNILGILGVTALVAPVPVAPEVLVLDVWVMLAAALVLVPFVFARWDVTRLRGAILTILYLGYVIVALG